MTITDIIRDEINAPFKSQLDVLHLFLLVGLLIVFAVLWSRILVRLESAAASML